MKITLKQYLILIVFIGAGIGFIFTTCLLAIVLDPKALYWMIPGLLFGIYICNYNINCFYNSLNKLIEND